MNSQAPASILMIRPSHFGYNPSTAGSNAFQFIDGSMPAEEISLQARKEFDNFADILKKTGIEVIIFEDRSDLILPDSVFPNNWISFHPDGTVVLYPMLADNRRLERREDILLTLQNQYLFNISRVLDYTRDENSDRYLEGTGSMVLDYVNGIAYANSSPRTEKKLFKKVCEDLGIEGILFEAYDNSGREIYHTNVMMCIGSGYVVICMEAVRESSDRSALWNSFKRSGHRVVEISYSQMECFAGNMIEVQALDGRQVLIMSDNALQSLKEDQIKALSGHAELLTAGIPIIEKYGGGSVRCMIAGIFLPLRSHREEPLTIR